MGGHMDPLEHAMMLDAERLATVRIAGLEAGLAQARETNARLNRRCQAADAALRDATRIIAKLSNGSPWVGGNFGRMLLAWHNSVLLDGVGVLAEALKFYAGLDAADLDWAKAVSLDERGQMARDALSYVENTIKVPLPDLAPQEPTRG